MTLRAMRQVALSELEIIVWGMVASGFHRRNYGLGLWNSLWINTFWLSKLYRCDVSWNHGVSNRLGLPTECTTSHIIVRRNINRENHNKYLLNWTQNLQMIFVWGFMSLGPIPVFSLPWKILVLDSNSANEYFSPKFVFLNAVIFSCVSSILHAGTHLHQVVVTLINWSLSFRQILIALTYLLYAATSLVMY